MLGVCLGSTINNSPEKYAQGQSQRLCEQVGSRELDGSFP